MKEKEATYVLFGEEAVQLYKISFKLLLNASNVDYRVGAFYEIKDFVEEAKNWNGFSEITSEQYELLQKRFEDLTNNAEDKKRKKGFFSFLK